jgi:cytochrome c-type biogenesis protein
MSPNKGHIIVEPNLWVAFIAGLASFLSPCVLPLVPAYIGYMGGRASNTAAAQAASPTLSKRISVFTHGVAFVAGFALVFVLIGLLSTAFIQQIGGSNIAFVRDVLARVGGVVIIFFGLHFTGLVQKAFNTLLARPALIDQVMFSLLFAATATALFLWAFIDVLLAIPFIGMLWLWLLVGGALTQPRIFWTKTIETIQHALYSDTRRHLTAQGKQNYLTSAFMGIVFAAGWTPCIGPIYGSILNLAWGGAEVERAGALMVAYSLGLGVPFLLAALLMEQAASILRRLSRHVHTVERFAGVFLVVVGVLVASGNLQRLSLSLNNQFADFSYQLESCASQVSTGQIPLGNFFTCLNTAEPGLDEAA